ncbi:MAG: precorrin-2 C(20)-methyltransferase [Saccharospirillaceae bacterium]|nr:precorrin-2 C(20)-methyltransferase [Pseudomonadales bacterium]NRB78066.1 precorrin-2 C(20)-methyltransferase [Saccharospirillaceae bacterium]
MNSFVGVGVGPGDPELMTLKAVRHIQSADVLAYLVNKEGHSQAKEIAKNFIEDQELLPILMPMADDSKVGDQVYDQASAQIQVLLDQDKKVAFLCEGDPLFYASFTYLLSRLEHNSTIVVPGISSPQSAACALQHPLTMLTESYCVITGRHDETFIEHALTKFDSIVIMKAGRARVKILTCLENTQRLDEAKYLEYIGRDNEYIQWDVKQLEKKAGPYFSMFVVTKATRPRV